MEEISEEQQTTRTHEKYFQLGSFLCAKYLEPLSFMNNILFETIVIKCNKTLEKKLFLVFAFEVCSSEVSDKFWQMELYLNQMTYRKT